MGQVAEKLYHKVAQSFLRVSQSFSELLCSLKTYFNNKCILFHTPMPVVYTRLNKKEKIAKKTVDVYKNKSLSTTQDRPYSF
jgi:hypothetical protein